MTRAETTAGGASSDGRRRHAGQWHGPLAPIPDGIRVYGGGRCLNLMMSHELDGDGVEGPFAYARVSKLAIDLQTLAIVDHDYITDGIS